MDSQDFDYYRRILTNELNFDDECNVNNLGSMGDCPNQFSGTSQANVEAESARGQGRSGSFSAEEDELLVSAWLNTSTDPVRGNGQKNKRYWVRVHEFFHDHKTFSSDRTSNSLLNRWSPIQGGVNKFCGYYSQIDARRQSGINEQDKIHQAKLMYYEMQGSTFNLDHCWNKLRLAPKWLEVVEKKNNQPKKTKKSTANTSSIPNTINVEEEITQVEPTVNIERPPGTTGEKKRLKQKKETEQTTNTIVKLIEEMRNEKKMASAHKKETLEKLVAIQEKKEEDREKLMAIQEKKEEDRVMSMDLSKLSPLQVEYYMRRQQEIFDKMQ